MVRLCVLSGEQDEKHGQKPYLLVFVCTRRESFHRARFHGSSTPVYGQTVDKFRLATPPPHLKRQPQQAKYILRQAMEGILPDTVRLRKGGVPFSHFRRKGLVQEANYFNEVVSNPLLAQLGFVNLKQWEEELTRYKLGIVDTWNIFRTPIQTDSLLSVEVWLRTCLPQFPKAYTRITNPEKRRI